MLLSYELLRIMLTICIEIALWQVVLLEAPPRSLRGSRLGHGHGTRVPGKKGLRSNGYLLLTN